MLLHAEYRRARALFFCFRTRKTAKLVFLLWDFTLLFFGKRKKLKCEIKTRKVAKPDFWFSFLYFARYFSLPDFCSGITCNSRVASIEFVFKLGTKFARFGVIPQTLILKNRPEKGIVITQRKIGFCDFALYKFEIRFLKIRHFRKSKPNTQKSEFWNFWFNFLK